MIDLSAFDFFGGRGTLTGFGVEEAVEVEVVEVEVVDEEGKEDEELVNRGVREVKLSCVLLRDR